jgi:outer membrane protein TolC
MRVSSFCSALTLLTLIPFAGVAAQDGPRPISLDEAVRLAQHNSPTTVQARNALRVGRATVTNALTQFLPNFGVNAGATNSNGSSYIQGKLTPYTGDPWNYSKGYSGSVVLFDGGQRWFNYRAAQLGLDASADNEVLQRFNVALSVKQQYYGVLAARESEAAAERQLEQAAQGLQVSAARVRVGAVIHTDSLRSAIAVGTAKLAIINAQNALRSSNASLTRLVASPVEVTATASDTSDVPRIDIDSVTLERLAADGPAVRQAVALLASNRGIRRAAITPYLPTVIAQYGYSTRKSSPTFDWGGGPAAPGTAYGFYLSYPLFNNYNRELNLTTALVAEENAQAGLRDAKLAAHESLALYLGAFRTASLTIDLQLLQIKAAEEDLQAQQQRYVLGSAALLDVLTSQTALDAARTALITARLQARTAKAQVEALIGRELK